MVGDNTEIEYDEPVDRDLPSVARGGASNSQKYIGAGLLLAVGALALYFAYASTKASDVAITTPTEEPYVVNTPPKPVAPKPPVFTAPPPVQQKEVVAKPARKPLVKRPRYDPAEVQRAARKRQAELDAMAAEQKRLEERRKSKQLVIGSGLGSLGFGESESERGSSALSARREAIEAQLAAAQSGQFSSSATSPLGGLTGGGSTVFSGTGENAEFFDAAADSKVPTERAVQLQNLDKMLPQGTIVKGILETRVVSDLPGMLRAITSEDTYSFDGANVLIPRGSRMVGRYNSGVTVGQTRVFVIWERVITPNGLSIRVNSPGTDTLGAAGNAGDVDNHWDEKFGAAILISVIEGAIDYAVAEASNGSVGVNIGGLGESSETIASKVLDKNLNIPPTITIDQGTRINILVSQDLDFSE